MVRFAKSVFVEVGRRIFGALSAPYLSHPDRIHGIEGASVHPTARIYVRGSAPEATGRVMLGRKSYLGRHVELAALANGELSIGEDTSIQDFCIIHGDVSIGSHCMFSMNNMISSTIHRFRDYPEWLIRDQDAELLTKDGRSMSATSDAIVIEDDCWFGWNVAVMPGVYVGRGAVVGANSVLTKDVGPYEIHGGVPNKIIGLRLKFQPPSSISALEDSSIPYFYRGFRVERSSLQRTRARGVVGANPSAAIVLRAGECRVLRLSGSLMRDQRKLQISVRVNGLDCGLHKIENDQFDLMIPVSYAGSIGVSVDRIPTTLKKFTYIEIEQVNHQSARPASDSTEVGYGIHSASLTN